MFSTPLICSSIGAITVVATTSALAPGYWPLTLMIGGTISGYCAIGRRMNDTPPKMMNTIDSTEAKIGRSMKKWEIFIARSEGVNGTTTSRDLKAAAGLGVNTLGMTERRRAIRSRFRIHRLGGSFRMLSHQIG